MKRRRKRTGAGWPPAAWALAAVLAAALPAGAAERIVRQHLDAGRVQFSGMDINGDGIADSLRRDLASGRLTYLVGDARRGFRAFDPAGLAEENRRFVPDILVEEDLDGDKIADLLLCNRAYLERYAADETVLLRILAGGVYIGQRKGTYLGLADAGLAGEARAAVIERARRIVAPPP